MPATFMNLGASMTPLDINQLKWDEFRSNPAVDAAYSDLLAVADRPILLHDRGLVPGVQNSFRTAWNGGIHIFLDLESPRRDHSIVHELLHEILTAEGYCLISGIPRVWNGSRCTVQRDATP